MIIILDEEKPYNEITLNDIEQATIIRMKGPDNEKKQLIEMTNRIRENMYEEMRKEFWS